MKAFSIVFIFVMCSLPLSACSPAQPSTGSIQTAVAQTLAASARVQPTTALSIQGEPAAPASGSQITPTAGKQVPPPPANGQRLLWSATCISHVNDEATVYCQLVDKNAALTANWKFEARKVQAFDLMTGAVRWETDRGGYLIGLDSKYLYIAQAKQRLEAVDKTNGSVAWEARFDEQVDFSDRKSTSKEKIIPVDQAQQVFILTVDETKLIAIDRNTGTVRDGFELGDRRFTQLDRVGNTLIFNDYGASFGLSLENLQLLWEFKGEGMDGVSLSGLCDNLLLLYQSQTSSDLAIDIATGKTVWESQDIGKIQTSCPRSTDPVLGKPGIFVDASENIYSYSSMSLGRDYTMAVNRATGKKVWEDEEKHKFLGEVGGLVIFASEGQGLTSAYSAQAHELLWENTNTVLFKLDGATQNTIIGTLRDGQIIGLDMKDGRKKWAHPGGEVTHVFILQGGIYVSNLLKSLWTLDAVDPETGSTNYSLPILGMVSQMTTIGDLIYGEVITSVFVIRP